MLKQPGLSDGQKVLLSHHPLQALLQRLRQMRGLDFLIPCQISNRPCQFKHAMVAPCQELQLARCHAAEFQAIIDALLSQ